MHLVGNIVLPWLDLAKDEGLCEGGRHLSPCGHFRHLQVGMGACMRTCVCVRACVCVHLHVCASMHLLCHAGFRLRVLRDTEMP